MSWLYVPGSAGSPSDSSSWSETFARSVTWRGKLSASTSWSRRAKRVLWIMRLSGLISEPSMASRGVASWISSLLASRASPTASPASDAETPTSALSGPRSPGSSATASPQLSSSRTSTGLLFEDPLLTFEQWASSCVRLAWRLPRTSARRTSGSGGLLSLPTPTARDFRSGKTGPKVWAHRQDPRNARPLSEVIERLPTPTTATSYTNDPERIAAKTSGGHRRGHQGAELARIVENLPTPTASDAKRSGAAGYSTASGRHSGTTLTDAVLGAASAGRRGQLNPQLCEWMLGFPIGWTASAPSEMEWVHWWWRMRGGL